MNPQWFSVVLHSVGKIVSLKFNHSVPAPPISLPGLRESSPILKIGNFPVGKEAVVDLRPGDEHGFLAVDFIGISAERVFLYRLSREFAERLLCWNCDLASSSDKLCGRGLSWPKSGAGGAGFSLHFAGCGWSAFMGLL
jgi:hypothetical protein